MKKEIIHRQTKQRKVILEELKKTKTHPTADMLFMMVKDKLPRVSFGTVYRNLNFLKEKGEVVEINIDKNSCRYDADIKPHYHFSCLKCHKVLDLDIPVLKYLDRKVEEKEKIKVNYHRIYFYGYCRDCR